ncbi:MAG: nuclear transport factor 2 family protein [Dehalococcoidia bacterium]
MTSTSQANLDVAKRFFEAGAGGDVDALRACYAAEAKIWHNVDGKEQTVDENLRISGWVRKNVAGYRYENVQRQATESGFLQQHVIRGTSRNGTELAIASCLVARVADGKITRLDEYIDSAATSALFA